jgi:hypothetical protein
LAGHVLARLFHRLDTASREDGKPFQHGAMMVPHTESRFYGWTHYGVMIPNLPAPHRFYSLMSIVGTPGATVFDTDHMLVDRPRRNATAVTGTAATYPRHFGSYSIDRDCTMHADGSLIRFGQHITITGQYPEYRLQTKLDDFELDIRIRNTDKVTWFIKLPIYDHISLLSEYEGHILQGDSKTTIAGLCTFEYAAGPSAYSFVERTLPARTKVPVDFFTYQIINLDAQTQLLLSKVDCLGTPMIQTAWIRSLDQYTQTYREVEFTVTGHQAEAAVAPDGRTMQLPETFTWIVTEGGSPLLIIEGRVDTPFSYGLGSGYVGGYAYKGQYRGEPISGRGYIEYIDRRNG